MRRANKVQIGDKFGRLEVIELGYQKRIGESAVAVPAVLCRCVDCGRELVVPIKYLLWGKVTGCGYGHGKLQTERGSLPWNAHQAAKEKLGLLKPIPPQYTQGLVLGKWKLLYKKGDVWLCEDTKTGDRKEMSEQDLRSIRLFSPGIKYAHWTIIERIGQYNGRYKCVCGHEQSFPLAYLATGMRNKCKNCGRGYDIADVHSDPMIGQKFGRLTVIQRAADKVYRNGSHEKHYLCECTCGNLKIVRGDRLRLGYTRSCGCLQRDKAKHLDVTPDLAKLSYRPTYLNSPIITQADADSVYTTSGQVTDPAPQTEGGTSECTQV